MKKQFVWFLQKRIYKSIGADQFLTAFYKYSNQNWTSRNNLPIYLLLWDITETTQCIQIVNHNIQLCDAVFSFWLFPLSFSRTHTHTHTHLIQFIFVWNVRWKLDSNWNSQKKKKKKAEYKNFGWRWFILYVHTFVPADELMFIHNLWKSSLKLSPQKGVINAISDNDVSRMLTESRKRSHWWKCSKNNCDNRDEMLLINLALKCVFTLCKRMNKTTVDTKESPRLTEQRERERESMKN